MGNYITSAEFVTAGLEREAISRTDLARTGAMVEVKVEGFIAQAESEMNKEFARGGYAIPLSAPLDPMIIPIAIDVARYRWWVGANPPAQVGERYKLAQAMLKRIGDGVTLLDIEGEEETSDQCPVEVRARDEVFTDDALAGF